MHLHGIEHPGCDFLDGMNVEMIPYGAYVLAGDRVLVEAILGKPVQDVHFLECCRTLFLERPVQLNGSLERFGLPDQTEPFKRFPEAGIIQHARHVHPDEETLLLFRIHGQRNFMDK